jgi:polyketide synthase PksN
VMCVNGLYPTMPEYPFVPGFEVAGVVSRVGREVSGIQVGDEVIALTGPTLGGHASRVNVPAANVAPKPRNLTFEEAASLPVVFSTVLHAFETARLGAGELVLIQTATGGCGLAALQLARARGGICYGTSSRPPKRDLLRRLGVDHVLDYATAFDDEIRRLTAGRGVDVVLNMLSGEAIQRGLNSLAPSGRYIEIAVHALKTSAKLDLSRLVHNQSIHSVDLRRLTLGGDGPVRLREIAALAEAGDIVPIVSRIYPAAQIVEALDDRLRRGLHRANRRADETRRPAAAAGCREPRSGTRAGGRAGA